MKKTVKILAMFLAMTVLFSSAQIAFATEEVLPDYELENVVTFDFEEARLSNSKIFSRFSGDVTVAESIREEDGWEFVEDEGYAIIIEAPEPKKGKTIEMPETLGGCDVIGWFEDAFEYIDTEYKLRIADNFPEALFELGEDLDAEDELYETLLILLSALKPTDFKVGSKNEYFSAKHGVLYSKDKTILVRYPVGRDADFYYLPKKVSFFKETRGNVYVMFPFLNFDFKHGEIEYTGLTVHLHADAMQSLYDIFEELADELGVNEDEDEAVDFAFSVVLMESMMSVNDVCTDWDSDVMDFIEELCEELRHEIKDEFMPLICSCDTSHISDMSAWEVFLMIFFFGWIWY